MTATEGRATVVRTAYTLMAEIKWHIPGYFTHEKWSAEDEARLAWVGERRNAEYDRANGQPDYDGQWVELHRTLLVNKLLLTGHKPWEARVGDPLAPLLNEVDALTGRLAWARAQADKLMAAA